MRRKTKSKFDLLSDEHKKLLIETAMVASEAPPQWREVRRYLISLKRYLDRASNARQEKTRSINRKQVKATVAKLVLAQSGVKFIARGRLRDAAIRLDVLGKYPESNLPADSNVLLEVVSLAIKTLPSPKRGNSLGISSTVVTRVIARHLDLAGPEEVTQAVLMSVHSSMKTKNGGVRGDTETSAKRALRIFRGKK